MEKDLGASLRETQNRTLSVCVLSCFRVRLLATPRTVTCLAPVSMGFPRQECWSGLPFPSHAGSPAGTLTLTLVLGGSSPSRDRTWVSLIADRFFTVWATREAQPY